MRSMTGYGRQMLARGGREMTVEVKSVNHRFLDIGFRTPRNLAFLEDVARRVLNERLNRGHVDVFINYRNARDDARVVVVDEPLLRAYEQAFGRMAEIAGRIAAAHALGDRTELESLVGTAVRWTFVPAAVVIAGILAVGYPVLAQFGETFTDAYPLMFILAAGILVKAAMGPSDVILNMMGHQRVTALSLGA
ncbi:MAG TPA: hypothetical protein PKE04_09850, partial [Clostridia bacterium]|nr:hypothetical protein [Clostridia bacterium]